MVNLKNKRPKTLMSAKTLCQMRSRLRLRVNCYVAEVIRFIIITYHYAIRFIDLLLCN